MTKNHRLIHRQYLKLLAGYAISTYRIVSLIKQVTVQIQALSSNAQSSISNFLLTRKNTNMLFQQALSLSKLGCMPTLILHVIISSAKLFLTEIPEKSFTHFKKWSSNFTVISKESRQKEQSYFKLCGTFVQLCYCLI